MCASSRRPTRTCRAKSRAGRFREDLFYRLNVIPFFVPPLRERREDIPILARYFMRVFSAEHGRGPKDFSSDALDMLVDYSWPGNVRELRNEIERLVIMVQNDVIQADDLSLPNGTGSDPRVHSPRSPGTVRTRVHPVETQREQLEYLADRQAAGTRAKLSLPEDEELRYREIIAGDGLQDRHKVGTKS